MQIHPLIYNRVREVYHSLLFTRNKYKYLLKYGTSDFFNDLNIETNTGCNRTCSYCPNSIFDRGNIKNQKLMDESLFKKIIDELADLNFTGRISPERYGEPLLDPRIVKFMKYIRQKLTSAKILMISNGDYLSVEMYLDLINAGVNSFSITQHSSVMSKNMRNLFTYIKKNPEKKVKIRYEVFGKNTPLYNRGGLVKPTVLKEKPRCQRPDNPLVINYFGDVVLCCNDYFSTIKFGNLRNKTLLEIWNSKAFTVMRRQLRKQQYTLRICKKCVQKIG